MKIHSKEDFDNFSPLLKDRLCGVYNICEKRGKGFGLEEVIVASYHTPGSFSNDMGEIFVAHLELNKELAKNQPEYIVSWDVYFEEEIVENNKETYKTYDYEKVKYYAYLKKNSNIRNVKIQLKK